MWELLIQDAQRWVDPEKIVDASYVTRKLTRQLMRRHMGLRAMFWFRFGQWGRQSGIPGMIGTTMRILYKGYGLEISPKIPVGGGLYIAHTVGTVIHARSIGRNLSVISAVTVGLRNEHIFPTLGNDVFIGAGARVLGDIYVGDDAVIGANAVVIKDVPAGATVVGIPAKVIHINGQKRQMMETN